MLLHRFFACLCTYLIIFSLNIIDITSAFATTTDNIDKKIFRISADFLNKPYGIDPLGEGPQGEYSQKPLYRFDQFDCQTYVETVLALARAQNFKQFQQQLLQIRYSNGKPDFFTRNHFPGADWIPHNIQKGYIKLVQINNQTVSIIIHKRQWMREKTNIDNPQIPTEIKVTLPYVSIDALPKVMHRIPQSAIIMMVNPSFLLISHMGFGIWKDHVLYLRSASSLHHKVIDEPLLAYLDQQVRYGDIKGIVVLKVLS